MRTVAKIGLTIPNGTQTSKSLNQSLASTSAGKAALGPSTLITIYPPSGGSAGTTIGVEVTPDDGANWYTALDQTNTAIAVDADGPTNIPFGILGDDFRIKSDTNASGDEEWIVFIQQD